MTDTIRRPLRPRLMRRPRTYRRSRPEAGLEPVLAVLRSEILAVPDEERITALIMTRVREAASSRIPATAGAG